MTSTRIKALDGFRTIAVLGVLWAHIWMFFGNPSGILFGVDVAKLISFFGTGVDLFFVISGFCMYFMYTSRNNSFSWQYYFYYLKKRWLRIAPAFYVAILLYGLSAASFHLSAFDWQYALHNAFFIKNFFDEATLYAPHFWSLCTEWHFYMVLPFIILGISRFSFTSCITVVVIVCLVCRYFFWTVPNDPYNVINYSIPNRLIEFVVGIVTARLYVAEKKMFFFNSNIGLLSGVVVAFAGRLLMSSMFQDRADLIGVVARVFNLPLLTIGMGLVIINTLQYRTYFTRVLESRFMNTVGKYSYSMYLWHWAVAGFLYSTLQGALTLNAFLNVNLVFLLSIVVLYPVSMISYKLLESVYFRKNAIGKSVSENKL